MQLSYTQAFNMAIYTMGLSYPRLTLEYYRNRCIIVDEASNNIIYMTKTAIKAELKGMWNETKVVNGVNVVRVCFRKNQYMIVANEETFDQCAERGFSPIQDFYYMEDLAKALHTHE